MFVETKKEGEVSSEPWRDLLLRAADEMERRGHTRGTLEDAEGRVCLYGAFNIAQHGYSTYRLTRDLDEASRRLCLWRGGDEAIHHMNSNADWNNAPERTGEEIVAAMRACALTKAQ